MTEEQALGYIAAHLAEYFVEEPHKITYWLMTDNLNFGGISPARLILIGRAHKVA